MSKDAGASNGKQHTSAGSSENIKATAALSATSGPSILKLFFAAGGIYFAFVYYGALQEDVFHWTAEDGKQFEEAWLLQTLEALANMVAGIIGIVIFGGSPVIPYTNFALSGMTQVCAKAFTSLSLAQGVSFPVVTLGKSGKMAPVMLGTLLLGGEHYKMKEYLAVFAIIAGTCMVSMGKKSSRQPSTWTGLACIVVALACDGLTAGVQSRMKADVKKQGISLKPFDFQFYTNLFMMIVGAIVTLVLGEFKSGFSFCQKHPHIWDKIAVFCLCSALGQCFIFYAISTFNPLMCTMVTTTRKVFSVVLSIFLNGHLLSPFGWLGLFIAFLGIMSEVTDKTHGATAPTSNGPNKQTVGHAKTENKSD
eukprot:gb/GEZN01010136.1/.p1 GENE.gb/GEZN01010136.1/~~gb/GEZN01010136.1/.p1  ORF type:complete len:382 (-),score=46.28 gb/GEZN01010136.1/:121-1215(-)